MHSKFKHFVSKTYRDLLGSTCDYKYIGSFLAKCSIQINTLFFLKYQSFFSVLSCPSSSSPSSTSAKFVYHFGRLANQNLSRWIYQSSVKTQHFKNKSQNLIICVCKKTKICNRYQKHLKKLCEFSTGTKNLINIKVRKRSILQMYFSWSK